MSMEPQQAPQRASEAESSGYNAETDDTVDGADLYEELINPNDADGSGSGKAGGSPMMMPPMGGAGMGGAGSAAGGGMGSMAGGRGGIGTGAAGVGGVSGGSAGGLGAGGVGAGGLGSGVGGGLGGMGSGGLSGGLGSGGVSAAGLSSPRLGGLSGGTGAAGLGTNTDYTSGRGITIPSTTGGYSPDLPTGLTTRPGTTGTIGGVGVNPGGTGYNPGTIGSVPTPSGVNTTGIGTAGTDLPKVDGIGGAGGGISAPSGTGTGGTGGGGQGLGGLGGPSGGGGQGSDAVQVSPELLREESKTWSRLHDDLSDALQLLQATLVQREAMGLVEEAHPSYDGLWQQLDQWMESGVREFQEISNTLNQSADNYGSLEQEAAAQARAVTKEI